MKSWLAFGAFALCCTTGPTWAKSKNSHGHSARPHRLAPTAPTLATVPLGGTSRFRGPRPILRTLPSTIGGRFVVGAPTANVKELALRLQQVSPAPSLRPEELELVRQRVQGLMNSANPADDLRHVLQELGLSDKPEELQLLAQQLGIGTSATPLHQALPAPVPVLHPLQRR